MYIILIMGEITKPSLVRLFAGVMYRTEFDSERVIGALEAAYGDIETVYGPIKFDWSSYYEVEMGEGLLKSYLIFKTPIDRARLPEIKIHTNELEQRFAAEGRRVVNIDPGYLTKDKLVLASTKDFFHRIYLGDGIYGETTLHYRHGRYRFFSWTYPDYQEPGLHKILEAARS